MQEFNKAVAQAPRAEFTGDGVQAVFPFDFAVFGPSDIEVRVNGAVVTAGFAVTLNADGRGKVTFANPPADGAKIVVARKLAFARDAQN